MVGVFQWCHLPTLKSSNSVNTGIFKDGNHGTFFCLNKFEKKTYYKWSWRNPNIIIAHWVDFRYIRHTIGMYPFCIRTSIRWRRSCRLTILPFESFPNFTNTLSPFKTWTVGTQIWRFFFILTMAKFLAEPSTKQTLLHFHLNWENTGHWIRSAKISLWKLMYVIISVNTVQQLRFVD